MSMLRTLLVTLALIPAPALAAAYPWEKIEAPSVARGPVIINYQINADGARIFGEVPNASKEVEIADNGAVLGRVATLPNYTFQIRLPEPLDPAVNHTLSVRGFDLQDRPVRLEGSSVSADRTSTTITFTKERLTAQRTSLETLQNPVPDSGAVTAAPSSLPAATPVATDEDAPSRWIRIALLFVGILAVSVAGYVVWKRRRRA